MMECAEFDSDAVLSDVHVQFQNKKVSINGFLLAETRFIFKIPSSLKCDEKQDCALDTEESSCDGGDYGESRDTLCNTDEDGDLVVLRNGGNADESVSAITIVHEMATSLDLVGQQVWPGALLLCDFVLHYHWLFDNAVILDLGAGVGLTSLVAALVAKTVFSTDYGSDVLDLASENVKLNSHLLVGNDVRVRQLDWKEEDSLLVHGIGCSNFKRNDEKNSYRWTSEDVDALNSCSVIFAAEVVYDLDLTDAFFRMLYKMLLNQPSKTVYMTVEKRQVFTVADKDIVSPAYEHFRENLKDLCSVDEGPVRFVSAQVDLTLPQYFQYQRTKEMELWKIETIFPHR